MQGFANSVTERAGFHGVAMHILIWIGTALTVAGILGLLWCIKLVLNIKRQALPDDQARAAMQRVVVWNMGALAVSGLGLILVVVGVILA